MAFLCFLLSSYSDDFFAHSLETFLSIDIIKEKENSAASELSET